MAPNVASSPSVSEDKQPDNEVEGLVDIRESAVSLEEQGDVDGMEKTRNDFQEFEARLEELKALSRPDEGDVPDLHPIIDKVESLPIHKPSDAKSQIQAKQLLDARINDRHKSHLKRVDMKTRGPDLAIEWDNNIDDFRRNCLWQIDFVRYLNENRKLLSVLPVDYNRIEGESNLLIEFGQLLSNDLVELNDTKMLTYGSDISNLKGTKTEKLKQAMIAFNDDEMERKLKEGELSAEDFKSVIFELMAEREKVMAEITLNLLRKDNILDFVSTILDGADDDLDEDEEPPLEEGENGEVKETSLSELEAMLDAARRKKKKYLQDINPNSVTLGTRAFAHMAKLLVKLIPASYASLSDTKNEDGGEVRRGEINGVPIMMLCPRCKKRKERERVGGDVVETDQNATTSFLVRLISRSNEKITIIRSDLLKASRSKTQVQQDLRRALRTKNEEFLDLQEQFDDAIRYVVRMEQHLSETRVENKALTQELANAKASHKRFQDWFVPQLEKMEEEIRSNMTTIHTLKVSFKEASQAYLEAAARDQLTINGYKDHVAEVERKARQVKEECEMQVNHYRAVAERESAIAAEATSGFRATLVRHETLTKTALGARYSAEKEKAKLESVVEVMQRQHTEEKLALSKKKTTIGEVPSDLLIQSQKALQREREEKVTVRVERDRLKVKIREMDKVIEGLREEIEHWRDERNYQAMLNKCSDLEDELAAFKDSEKERYDKLLDVCREWEDRTREMRSIEDAMRGKQIESELDKEKKRHEREMEELQEEYILKMAAVKEREDRVKEVLEQAVEYATATAAAAAAHAEESGMGGLIDGPGSPMSTMSLPPFVPGKTGSMKGPKLPKSLASLLQGPKLKGLLGMTSQIALGQGKSTPRKLTGPLKVEKGEETMTGDTYMSMLSETGKSLNQPSAGATPQAVSQELSGMVERAVASKDLKDGLTPTHKFPIHLSRFIISARRGVRRAKDDPAATDSTPRARLEKSLTNMSLSSPPARPPLPQKGVGGEGGGENNGVLRGEATPSTHQLPEPSSPPPPLPFSSPPPIPSTAPPALSSTGTNGDSYAAEETEKEVHVLRKKLRDAVGAAELYEQVVTLMQVELERATNALRQAQNDESIMSEILEVEKATIPRSNSVSPTRTERKESDRAPGEGEEGEARHEVSPYRPPSRSCASPKPPRLSDDGDAFNGDAFDDDDGGGGGGGGEGGDSPRGASHDAGRSSGFQTIHDAVRMQTSSSSVTLPFVPGVSSSHSSTVGVEHGNAQKGVDGDGTGASDSRNPEHRLETGVASTVDLGEEDILAGGPDEKGVESDIVQSKGSTTDISPIRPSSSQSQVYTLPPSPAPTEAGQPLKRRPSTRVEWRQHRRHHPSPSPVRPPPRSSTSMGFRQVASSIAMVRSAMNLRDVGMGTVGQTTPVGTRITRLGGIGKPRPKGGTSVTPTHALHSTSSDEDDDRSSEQLSRPESRTIAAAEFPTEDEYNTMLEEQEEKVGAKDAASENDSSSGAEPTDDQRVPSPVVHIGYKNAQGTPILHNSQSVEVIGRQGGLRRGSRENILRSAASMSVPKSSRGGPVPPLRLEEGKSKTPLERRITNESRNRSSSALGRSGGSTTELFKKRAAAKEEGMLSGFAPSDKTRAFLRSKMSPSPFPLSARGTDRDIRSKFGRKGGQTVR